MIKKFLLSTIFLTLIALFVNGSMLCVIGVYALHLWCLDNFESIINIGIFSLQKQTSPSEYRSLKQRFGNWAVVTGATDGIGREYVKELARLGINIVLVSRTAEKLIEMAHEIESNYNVATKCIIIDFCDGRSNYEHIKKELGDIPVGILVNCIGRMYEYPDELSNIPIDVLWNIINMNIGAMLTMSHIVIEGMKKRKRGAIVNISSGSELQPLPYVTLYSASKVFVRYFSLGLQTELAPYGISVQLLTPFCVQTKLHTYPVNVIIGNIFFPRVELFAKSAVYTLGKTTETTGYWAHAIMNGTMRLLPIYIRTWIMSTLAKRIRRAYLKDKRNMDTAVESIDE